MERGLYSHLIFTMCATVNLMIFSEALRREDVGHSLERH